MVAGATWTREPGHDAQATIAHRLLAGWRARFLGVMRERGNWSPAIPTRLPGENCAKTSTRCQVLAEPTRSAASHVWVSLFLVNIDVAWHLDPQIRIEEIWR